MKTSWFEAEQAIINTVSYVDVFDYPLTLAEIHRYLIRLPLTSAETHGLLDAGRLVPARLSRRDGLYMLPGREEVAEVRRQRRAASQALWPAAVAYGRAIARMPFVRMVAVTGSLSVNNVMPGGDIDYLVITADDHLWVSRAFVLLVVRWAARQGQEICPNYFLSQRALRLHDRNLYTAHELTHMVPLYGRSIYDDLRRANGWTARYLPNAAGPPPVLAQAQDYLRGLSPSPARDLVEATLGTATGRRIDRWEMTRKVRKFRRLYHGWQESDFSADTCKGHFNHHQQRVITAYAQRATTPIEPVAGQPQ
jgi:hypothetical protein